ncbi:T9SS type A sorting domain-containing protein [Flavobacterium sp. FlaQc-52]|uniref:T9SS type A sorting domain-containing protein n=1 Tax=Flavobacterium sp. FlaQc-52 TaxID=3374185 RepID=UPI0037566738
MRKNYHFLLILLVMFFYNNVAISQTSLGTCTSFMNSLKKEFIVSTGKREVKSVLLQTVDSKKFNGKINYKESTPSSEFLIGEIKDISESSFYIKVIGQSLEGHIILRKTKEAYKYSSDAHGNAYVSKVDINSLICVEYSKLPQKKTTTTKYNVAELSANIFSLESLPGGKGCVLLDFDGYNMLAGNYWNEGKAINAAPAGLRSAYIMELFEIVAEDFRPFNLNITTNEAVFNKYPKSKRMRIVLTTTKTASPKAGGVAYMGSFGWDNDVPAWCFNLNNGKDAGDTCSHEIGHTFGLEHDGRTLPTEEYFYGLDNTSWAPIMGFSYYRPVAQWSKGEYNSANNKESDVDVISGREYGVGYRMDDYGNDVSSAFSLTHDDTGLIIKKEGVIEKESDRDFFAFTTKGGNVIINANAINGSGKGNLHVAITLHNSTGAEIEKFWNPNPYSLNASMSIDLPAGKYFISVSGIGAGDILYGGYSAYGSVGGYSISGFISISDTPVSDIFISGVQTNVSCYGEADGVVRASVVGGSGNYTYAWTPFGGTTATASDLKAGIYSLIVKDDKGGSKTRTFNITEPPALNSNVTVGTEVLIADQSGATYQWYECPISSIDGETGQFFEPKIDGSYKVVMTLNGCTVSSDCINFNNLSTVSFDKAVKFMLHPNPSNKIITIKSDHDADLNLINSLGGIIKTFKVVAEVDKIVNVENLANGIYFICEIREGKLITHKFVKN